MKKNIKIVIYIILFIIVICGVINIINWKKDISANDKVKKELDSYIKVTKNSIDVDFSELKKKNEDTVAYITVKNTNINYPVVKASDNDYYLSHNFMKEENRAGWVFADYRNKFDGKDKNIIIYGHNMKDGSNLGSLKNVLSKDWYTNMDNLYIPLVTEDKTSIYKVFSIYQIEAEDYYIETDFKGSEFFSFLGIIKSRSIFSFNTKVNKDSQILTLSTCTDHDDERTVLHAIRVDE